MAKSARWFGFNPPFVGGRQNILSRQEDLRIIKNDLLQLLLTAPGERVHRPTFGTDIRLTIFDQGDPTSVDSLTDNILTAIATEEPRLREVSVNIVLLPDASAMVINVFGKLTNDPNVILELELKQPLSTGSNNTVQATSSGTNRAAPVPSRSK